MGSYSGFLLLEDLFDNMPDISTSLYNEAQQLFSPTVKVVEENCNTNLGDKIILDFSQVGQWDLALDRRLTRDDIEFFLSQGSYNRFVRNPPHCISPGGICRKCYKAVNPGEPDPTVGSSVKLNTYLIVATQYALLSQGDGSVILNTDGSDITRVSVYFNDEYTKNYTLSEIGTGELRLTYNGTVQSEDSIFIRMFKDTSSPYMSYLSATYSGNLLGASYLETGALPARTSLIKERITESRLASLEAALGEFAQYIPSTYMNYIANIKDPLERELYILALYGVFYDVGV